MLWRGPGTDASVFINTEYCFSDSLLYTSIRGLAFESSCFAFLLKYATSSLFLVRQYLPLSWCPCIHSPLSAAFPET